MARACAALGCPDGACPATPAPRSRRSARPGAPWWLQLYVTAERAAGLPLLERAVDAGAAAVVLTADTPVVGTKYDGDGPTVWDGGRPVLAAGQLPRRVRRAPGTRRPPTSAPRTWPGWPRPPGCRWWSRACCGPTTPGAASTRARRRCGSPTTGAASSTAASTASCLEAVVAEVGTVGGGVRRRGSALRPARAGRPGAGSARGVPGTAAALLRSRRPARTAYAGCSRSSTASCGRRCGWPAAPRWSGSRGAWLSAPTAAPWTR